MPYRVMPSSSRNSTPPEQDGTFETVDDAISLFETLEILRGCLPVTSEQGSHPAHWAMLPDTLTPFLIPNCTLSD